MTVGRGDFLTSAGVTSLATASRQPAWRRIILPAPGHVKSGH